MLTLQKRMAPCAALRGDGLNGAKPLAERIMGGTTKKIRTEKESLRHWRNIKPVLRKIMKENNGELPGWAWMKENGHSAVGFAISKYHGGFFCVRRKLHIHQHRKKVKYGKKSLKHWKNIEPVLRRIVRRNDGVLPGAEWMANNGYDRIATAIYKYHVGFPAVREKLDVPAPPRTYKERQKTSPWSIYSEREVIIHHPILK